MAHAGGHFRHSSLLTAAVLAIRYGHVRYPYREDAENDPGKAYVRE